MKKVLVACFSASNAKWEKGRQINRPNESEIKKWLAEVL